MKQILFFAMILLLPACIREVEEINYQGTDKPKLFVHCLLSPSDSVIELLLRKTRPFFSSQNDGNSESVNDASVTIFDGERTVQLKKDHPNTDYYKADASLLRITAGKTYYLSVMTENGLKANAHCTVPADLSFDFEIQRDDPVVNGLDTLFPFTVALKFPFHSKETNVPLLRYLITEIEMNDTTRRNQISIATGSTVLGQYLVKGQDIKRKDINSFVYNECIQAIIRTYESTVIQYRKNYNDNVSNTFDDINEDSTGFILEKALLEEPSELFTNIEGGFGLFGAYNDSAMDLK